MQNNLRDTLFRDPLMKAAGLQYVWPLDEASNCVRQSYSPPWACVPSAHMQPVNGPTQTTGLFGPGPYAAGLASASSQYLTTPSHAAIQTGTREFWVSAWVYLTSVGGSYAVVSKNSSGNYEWLLYISGGANAYMFVYSSSGGVEQ